MADFEDKWGKKHAADGTGVDGSPHVRHVKVLSSTPAASELHIGEVGGNSSIFKIAPTISATPDYSAGDVMGGKITLADICRAAGKAVVVNDIELIDADNQKPTGALYFFDADPSASTLTDNSAFVLHANDIAKVIRRQPIVSGDWVTVDSKGVCHPDFKPFVMVGATATLYAVFVVDGTFNMATTTAITGTLGLFRD